MALKATIYKAQLQISDMDRHYYATHELTLAKHPSETDERLMVRLIVFAMHADEYLEFGKGVSTDDEPDIWRKELTGEIAQWIDLGQPEVARIRKACGRARQVVVINYGGRSADLWWEKSADELERSRNLRVINLPHESLAALTSLAERSMQLQCLIQDRQIQLLSGTAEVTLEPVIRVMDSRGA